MGWSFRKSIKFGPMRVNFSKSGVGVSAGVKGARISTGPRGTYLNVGRGGVSYRQKIGGTGGNANRGTNYQSGSATESVVCTVAPHSSTRSKDRQTSLASSPFSPCKIMAANCSPNVSRVKSSKGCFGLLLITSFPSRFSECPTPGQTLTKAEEKRRCVFSGLTCGQGFIQSAGARP